METFENLGLGMSHVPQDPSSDQAYGPSLQDELRVRDELGHRDRWDFRVIFFLGWLGGKVVRDFFNFLLEIFVLVGW